MQIRPFSLRVDFILTILLAGILGRSADAQDEPRQRTVVEGGIVRGNVDRREVALVFTADAHGEGTKAILDTLAERKVHGSFFLTGAYLHQPAFQSCVRRMVKEGHYVGPHSHGHLLYCPWEDRPTSLVTEQEFKSDLQKNLAELQALGVSWRGPTFFIPPFEWYNARHAQWAQELGCILFTFTPGSGLHGDWMPESHPKFKSSEQLLAEFLEYERQSTDGINGHILLMHLGTERQDKLYQHLGRIIDALRQRGYVLVTVDQLLKGDH